jgi:hypothetical protein
METLQPGQLPKAYMSRDLFPISQEKVLKRIPVIVRTQEIVQHIDAALLEKLTGRRFGQKEKQARGKKKFLPASLILELRSSVVDLNLNKSESEKKVCIRIQTQ